MTTNNRTTLPFVRGSATSKAAAASMVAIAPSIKRRIYDFILSRGARGATDDELEVALDLTHQTASSRRYALAQAGAVKRTDEKRPTRSGRSAFVYVAEPGAALAAKPGRPPKSPGDRHNVKVTAYLTREQHADLCMMAAERDVPPGKLLRIAWQAFNDTQLRSAATFISGGDK